MAHFTVSPSQMRELLGGSESLQDPELEAPGRWGLVPRPGRSHRFCLLSRFGLAAITGAARLTPALQTPSWPPMCS
jgi:hypothetical protein